MTRIAILLALLAAPTQALTLVDHGKSAYTIVIASQASPSEQHAAQELQRFLEEMSGARLPIATDAQPVAGNHLVLLGESAKLNLHRDFGPEEFLLRADGSKLIIAGGHQRGTLYGVYTFLDQLGCRWFTRDVSRIPKLPTIKIDALNEFHKPAFEYREPFFTEAWDKDWAARNRTNGDHTQLDASTGGKLQYYPFVHSFYQLLPPAKYFAQHPEYYSLIDGKRRTERAQLCLTNPDVLRLVTAQVETWIAEHPEATIFSVSQNDWEGWCECDRCRRVEQEEGGQHSGPLLRFVNAVAEEVGKRHPGKLIDTLAYWYTENPPLHVRPAPNVRIRLCPIGICVAHSFATCPRSAYFYRNLQAWSAITNQLYIWHYNTNFSHYQLPFPDFDELAADIPIYRKHGVVGLFLQGAYPPGGGGENSELRAYVLARLLWDPSIDVNRTIDEFMATVYGPSAGAMRQYFDLLHAQVRPPAARHLWIFNVPDYSDSFLRDAQAVFARAEAAAPDDATRKRVEKARLPVDYYQYLRDSAFDIHDGLYGPADLPSLIPQARALLARMRSFGIQSIHESQPLDKDERAVSDLHDFPAFRMENTAWRVDVVPGLDGRVVRMIDKASGRDLLRELPPGERGMPNTGGQVVSAHDDYYAKAWDVRWTVEDHSAQQVRLTGTCPNGILLDRVLELTETGLHTVTIANNKTSSPKPVALESHIDLAPADIDSALMSFQPLSGQAVNRRLIVAEEPPADKASWNGSDRPAREWRLVENRNVVFARFPESLVGRSYANWTAKSRPGVSLGLWSPEKTLPPGQSLRLETDYGRLRNVPDL
ncbi:MAG TPA: DUF4838 domain-containing protein [Bryobacteraceae bacterium]